MKSLVIYLDLSHVSYTTLFQSLDLEIYYADRCLRLCIVALRCVMLCCSAIRCVVLRYVVLFCDALCCSAIRCVVLRCVTSCFMCDVVLCTSIELFMALFSYLL